MNVRIPVIACALIASACVLARPSLAQASSPSRADLKIHYSRVVQELRAADVAHLTLTQRRERLRLIGVLDRYRRAADFGVNTDYPGENKPYFVDRQGRRCAVAYLLDRSGMGTLTLSVQRSANHAWVAELADDARLGAWLRRSGLTIEEAARIQGPGQTRRTPGGQPAPPGAPVAGFGDPVPPGENWQPEDVQSGPTSPPVSSGSQPPQGPRVPSGGVSGRRTGAAPRGTSISSLPRQDWSTWWGWNRHEFIHPRHRQGPAAKISANTTVSKRQTGVTDEVLAMLRAHLRHGSAPVRGAATVALGRLGGSNAVPALVGMLKDPTAQVRHSAILALGGTGSPRGVFELLHIAKEGKARGEEAKVGPLAQPLAMIALGLAHRYGSGVDASSLVHSTLFRASSAKDPQLQLGRLLYQVLAPSSKAIDLAHGLAVAKGTPLALRCRALEVLPGTKDKAALVTLIRALNGHRLEARRSAALALGRFDHKLALQPLMTAFELSGEVLTRAFLLVSIGRQGSAAGRSFLMKHVNGSRKSLRPWAALGLGLSVRASGKFDDQRVRNAILKASAAERNRAARGAYLVALGLVRDRKSVPAMVKALTTAKVSGIRTAAAEALVLVGPDAARPPLRERLRGDLCYYARSVYAGILGAIGDPADAAVLAEAFREESHPTARGRIAMALGMLDAEAGLDALSKMLKDDATPAHTRAQVIEGLGISLARRPALEMAELYQQANFLAFPGWFQALLPVSL